MAAGTPIPHIAQHATYTDFVEAEQSLLASAKSDETLDFWRPLFGSWTPQDLISDRPVSDQSIGLGAVHQIHVDNDLAAALHRVAGERRLSVKSMVLAAYQAALHRVHGLDQVVVAEIKANRSVRDARSIGCYMNPIARSSVVRARPHARITHRPGEQRSSRVARP